MYTQPGLGTSYYWTIGSVRNARYWRTMASARYSACEFWRDNLLSAVSRYSLLDKMFVFRQQFF